MCLLPDSICRTWTHKQQGLLHVKCVNHIRQVICGFLAPTLSLCAYRTDGNCSENCGTQKQHSALRCSTGTQSVLIVEVHSFL